MASEQKSSPIANLVHKVLGSQSRPETSEQLAAELQKHYKKHINVLTFISKIADPSVLLAPKKDEVVARASEKICKDCDHPHIDDERHRTDTFIHIHDPVQKQHYYSACFRNTLPSPCCDCTECYEDNKLSARDDVEHEAIPKYSWVWRDTKTINGITGHLVYQVPDNANPIRTREGFAIPWHRYYCGGGHLPQTPAAALKRAKRVAIKDLIEEDYWETNARAERCNAIIGKFGTKAVHIKIEGDKYYGFLLDTTELDTEDRMVVLSLFDMAIVETIKTHPEITLGEFNKEVARRIRVWTRDHFHACNGAIRNLLGDIEAQGFVKRRINEDKSEILLSDFDKKDCSKNEIVRENDAVVSFGALEQAELDTTSSLQRLQAALEELRLDTDTFGHERRDTITSYRDHLEMAAENTAWALIDLERAIVKAHATLDDLESDREGCQEAHASWKTGLADFETMSKFPRNTIETTLAERKKYNETPEYSAVMLEKLQQAIVELRPELDELNAGLEACRIHIAGYRGHPISKTVAHCGAPTLSSSDDGSSVHGFPCDAAMKAEGLRKGPSTIITLGDYNHADRVDTALRMFCSLVDSQLLR